MLMSIFSPFDALSGETFGHKKVELLRSPVKGTKVDGDERKVAPVKGKSGNSTAEPPADAESKKLNGMEDRRRLRFAPELDGVYWFETIIPC